MIYTVHVYDFLCLTSKHIMFSFLLSSASISIPPSYSSLLPLPPSLPNSFPLSLPPSPPSPPSLLPSLPLLSLYLFLPSFSLPFFPLTFLPLSFPPFLSEQFISTLKPSKDLLNQGKKFTFRVTILQATGIPRDFTDVFVQFRFLNGGDEAFSTEPLKNENQDLALGFYHMQNVREGSKVVTFLEVVLVHTVCG